ncbi:hypothetical protein ACU4GG_37465 [Streptomyces nojiriensis]
MTETRRDRLDPAGGDLLRAAVAWHRAQPRRAAELDGVFRVPPDGVLRPGRRIALTEYGARWYDEGVDVYMLVDLETGAVIRATDYQVTAHWPENLRAFFTPDLIPADDPVRAWPAGSVPGSRDPGELVPVRPDQVERAAAVVLVARHRPDLAGPVRLRLPERLPHSSAYPYADRAAAQPNPELLPGTLLFGDGPADVPAAFG